MKIKKYLAEFFGTMVLVLFGCGSAVVCQGLTAGVSGTVGVLTIAFSFGLSVIAAAYAIGHVSGCHINPAISLAVFINGKMTFTDFIGYVVAQFAGGFAGSGILKLITNSSDMLNGFGSNGFGELSSVNISMTGAAVVEFVLTFVFIMTVLGVTSSEKTSDIAGLVIGLTLTFVHIIGIPLTGTSVNPARSLAPAVFEGGTALSQVWLFIVVPFAGAAAAALIFRFVFKNKED